MNMKLKILVLLVGMSSMGCLANPLYKPPLPPPPLPTNNELRTLLQTSNGLYRIENVISNLGLYREVYEEEDASRVCYQLLTNAIILVSRGRNEDVNFYKRPSTESGRWLLRRLFGGNCFGDDRSALNLYADCIADVTLFNTNGFMREVHEAVLGDKVFEKTHPDFHSPTNHPHLEALKARWMPKHIHNRLAGRHREELFTGFLVAMRNYERGMPESERTAFRSNMVERAKLSPAERERLLRYLQ